MSWLMTQFRSSWLKSGQKCLATAVAQSIFLYAPFLPEPFSGISILLKPTTAFSCGTVNSTPCWMAPFTKGSCSLILNHDPTENATAGSMQAGSTCSVTTTCQGQLSCKSALIMKIGTLSKALASITKWSLDFCMLNTRKSTNISLLGDLIFQKMTLKKLSWKLLRHCFSRNYCPSLSLSNALLWLYLLERNTINSKVYTY